MNTKKGGAHLHHRVRVLIADNSKDFVWLLVQFLSGRPEIEIIGVAYDGRQTIEMIKQTKPDILLLDLIMPDMDGLEVLRDLTKIHIPLKVFVISALGDENLIDMAVDFGVEQYFVKPLDLKVVASAILSEA